MVDDLNALTAMMGVRRIGTPVGESWNICALSVCMFTVCATSATYRPASLKALPPHSCSERGHVFP